MYDKIQVVVTLNGEAHQFNSGAEAYIFHSGIYNDMLEKYDTLTLRKYVDIIYTAYLADSNRTPLGKLADYVAEHWEDILHESPSKYELLDDFYEQYDII